jgi:subtilisin-like proprotein convertase family protein
MNNMKTKILAVLAATILLAAGASASIVTFDSTTQNGGNPINMGVPDGNPVGIVSTINVNISSWADSMNSLTMTLNISGGNNGDLYAYLSYGGQIVTLLNRPGVTGVNPVGYTDPGLNVTLTDGNPGNINTYGSSSYTTSGGQVTGTYNPAAGSTAFATSYNGMNPNGNWTLFVADMSGGDINFSQLDSWSLTFNAVPEPVNVALGVFAAALLAVAGWRRARGYFKPSSNNKAA